MAGKVTRKRLGGMDMTEYKIGKAIVRMHGTPNREIIEPAAARFLARVEQKKRKLAKEGGERNDRKQTAVR
jgi:hypothetical protein